MRFKITQQSKKSKARLGIIKTSHGILRTPALFPVATQAVVKTLDSGDIKQIGYGGVLANTYHLYLKPGENIIKKMGGLHKFMNFDGVIATDSGGFQVFSLGAGIEQGLGKIVRRSVPYKKCKAPSALQNHLVKITEEGVYFKSHYDGSRHFLSPEKSMQIQQDLGANIIFAFDECASPLAGFEYTKKSMERTHRWSLRCLKQHQKNDANTSDRRYLHQGLFGIIQGGEYKKLREQSAKFIGSLDFDGFGIGGSFGKAYGDNKKNIAKVLSWTIPLLPQEKPRHLLGIGYLDDMEVAIKNGVDLFDCVYPTRIARHGIAILGKSQSINLQKAIFLKDKKPLLTDCLCPTCQNHSRAYICHLFRAKEITAQRLLTMHNLWFFKQFIDNIRGKIADGKL